MINTHKTQPLELTIRKATITDSGLILNFVKQLAKYEKTENQVTASIADIKNNLFNKNTTTKTLICSYKKQTIGFAVYFLNFSTWLGKKRAVS